MRTSTGLKRILAVVLVAGLLWSTTASAQTGNRCANGKSADGAMWFSILHPGLGEYFLKGWGPWGNMPEKKFFLGFIPFYGWPGYLQAKSAYDASKCRTNDELDWKD